MAALKGDDRMLELTKRVFLSSFEARALAVLHVTDSSATGNPGLGEGWISDADKGKAMAILSDHDYHSEPYLSFSIHEDKSNRMRQISLPTFFDRAIHDMYRMALEPAIEPILDKRLFSSREGRSLADACEETVYLLTGADAPLWVLRCDVRSFYDTIDHKWLMDNMGMDADILRQILDPGHKTSADSNITHNHKGVPMGDRLSPLFANMILNGIGNGLQDPDDPLNGVIVRWVDDFIITAHTEDDAKRYLGHVIAFLAERNMTLNMEKTYIANVRRGFEFLKYRFRRVHNTIEVYPSEDALEDFRNGVRYVCSLYRGDDKDLIKRINSRIRGFATKYRMSDLRSFAESLDSFIDDSMTECISSFTRVPRDVVRRRIHTADDTVSVDGIVLSKMSSVLRVPHARVWLTANPYIDREYFENRRSILAESKVVKEKALWDSRDGMCAVCGLPIQWMQERMIANDIDGSRGYIHSCCLENTAYSEIKGRFITIGSRNIAGTSTTPVSDEPKRKPVKEHAPTVMPKERFTAAPVVKNSSGRRSKFQLLTDHLSHTEGRSVTMSFKDIESVLGEPLCNTAKTNTAHWMRKGAGLRNAVESAGWIVGDIDIDGGNVTFIHEAPKNDIHTPAEKAYLMRLDRMFGAKDIKRRDNAMRVSRFGRVTRYLLDCGYDQILWDFADIEKILGKKLPPSSSKRDMWSSRAPGKMLIAIEDGDFEKTMLDLKNRRILITRVYCEPDVERGTVEEGKLKMKPGFSNAVR